MVGKYIIVATDAWDPQINGVVTTLQNLKKHALGHDMYIRFLTPNNFKTINNYFYPEVRLAVPWQETIDEFMKGVKFDYIHIATEGPIGLAMRKWCLKRGYKFTTSYHTNWAKGLKPYCVPEWVSTKYLKWFHSASACTMVATNTLQLQLVYQGYKPVAIWSRGVDEIFKPPIKKFKGQIEYLYVGRLSKEKGLRDFLNLELDGIKTVVGDGPDLSNLRLEYSNVNFKGPLQGQSLALYYQQADVFVFPSQFDTFGLVVLEAISCGTPVAAYPVQGPLDILTQDVSGVMDWDLRKACAEAVKLDREKVYQDSKRFSWKVATKQFADNLIPL